jgi:hypothetical protein
MQHRFDALGPLVVQLDAARQPHAGAVQHQDGNNAPAQLHQHADIVGLDQIQGCERGDGQQAGLKAGGPKRRLVSSHDLGGHHRRQHFHFSGALAAARLLPDEANYGRIHVERNALLHAKAQQGKLLAALVGEGVKIEHRHARAVVRQNQGRAAFAISVERRDGADALLQHEGLLDVVVHRRNLQHARVERREAVLRGSGDARAGDTLLRHLKDVRRRRIF